MNFGGNTVQPITHFILKNKALQSKLLMDSYTSLLTLCQIKLTMSLLRFNFQLLSSHAIITNMPLYNSAFPNAVFFFFQKLFLYSTAL